MGAKKNIVLQALSNFIQKGTIKNSAAQNFLTDACKEVGEQAPNDRIIAEISKNLERLSPLTDEDLALLKEVLARYPSLATPEETSAEKTVTEIKNTVSLHMKNITITDMTDSEQNYQDEYNFILNSKRQARKYLLQTQEKANDGRTILKYSNYVFGNFDISYPNTDKRLMYLFSRNNVVNSILKSYGYMNLDGNTCTNELKQAIFSNLCRKQPSAHLRRVDASEIVVLRIGSMTISSPNSLEETLEQYLVCNLDNSRNRQLYLCYGRINFNLLKTLPRYNYTVANILLSTYNLNSSSYIGSISGNSVVKSSISFEDSVHTCSFLK